MVRLHRRAYFYARVSDPRLDLDNLAVPVVAVNEGVGSRLWDHPGAAFFLMPKKRGLVKNDDPIIQTVCRYDSGETGFPNDLQIQPGSVITAPRFNIPMVMMMCCVEKAKFDMDESATQVRTLTRGPRYIPASSMIPMTAEWR